MHIYIYCNIQEQKHTEAVQHEEEMRSDFRNADVGRNNLLNQHSQKKRNDTKKRQNRIPMINDSTVDRKKRKPALPKFQASTTTGKLPSTSLAAAEKILYDSTWLERFDNRFEKLLKQYEV